MKIGIDARFFGIRQKGLGRYTQKLVENLEKIDPVNEYFVFLQKDNFEEYQPKNPNFQKILADYKWYTFGEQVFFPRMLYKYGLDLVHFPHFNVPLLYFKRFIVTIHDLTLVHFPTVKNSTLHPVFYWIKFFAYLAVIRAAIVRAESVIAISQFTKDDVIKKYGPAIKNKTVVTYEACEDFCMFSQRNGQEILREYGIIKPYLIYVGNAYPHKNLDRLVLAFARAFGERNDFQLVLVGKNDYFYGRLRKTVQKHRIEGVIFLSDVSDYELDSLFHCSVANVFPSLYEGFGLPPLEAMSKGVPVISSDHPCMREVLGESAHFFDGQDVAAITEAMARIVSDVELREDLIGKGYNQARKYSWKKMAEETLAIYSNKA
ncbi:MAG: glycosyltransferase family 1 protein [Candidatus Moranbacteria bacterium]|nr:glycosyltransferase family 1 protein [Candidatus Moranbacteria bacterium]